MKLTYRQLNRQEIGSSRLDKLFTDTMMTLYRYVISLYLTVPLLSASGKDFLCVLIRKRSERGFSSFGYQKE